MMMMVMNNGVFYKFPRITVLAVYFMYFVSIIVYRSTLKISAFGSSVTFVKA